MSPKQRFVVLLEPGQLAALQEIERRIGASISEQIRRAIDVYLDAQTFVEKAEIERLRR
jgi:hypothetical protein